MFGVVKINEDLFLVKRTTSLRCEPLAQEWNALSPNHKTFKKDEKLYFCELIEEVIPIEENLENPII